MCCPWKYRAHFVHNRSLGKIDSPFGHLIQVIQSDTVYLSHKAQVSHSHGLYAILAFLVRPLYLVKEHGLSKLVVLLLDDEPKQLILPTHYHDSFHYLFYLMHYLWLNSVLFKLLFTEVVIQTIFFLFSLASLLHY